MDRSIIRASICTPQEAFLPPVQPRFRASLDPPGSPASPEAALAQSPSRRRHGSGLHASPEGSGYVPLPGEQTGTGASDPLLQGALPALSPPALAAATPGIAATVPSTTAPGIAASPPVMGSASGRGIATTSPGITTPPPVITAAAATAPVPGMETCTASPGIATVPPVHATVPGMEVAGSPSKKQPPKSGKRILWQHTDGVMALMDRPFSEGSCRTTLQPGRPAPPPGAVFLPAPSDFTGGRRHVLAPYPDAQPLYEDPTPPMVDLSPADLSPPALRAVHTQRHKVLPMLVEAPPAPWSRPSYDEEFRRPTCPGASETMATRSMTTTDFREAYFTDPPGMEREPEFNPSAKARAWGAPLVERNPLDPQYPTFGQPQPAREAPHKPTPVALPRLPPFITSPNQSRRTIKDDPLERNDPLTVPRQFFYVENERENFRRRALAGREGQF
ncbi:hypothetical protein PAPYR_1037 [Paratrimastix pyriformis]|uniref:Uncharacterized protein n=1 Tax=Paratrimastix pyriformis TaxID=342808 RepID=A0ABQ8V001_9EUKA|nr:hypothetical protein PAPYR_1037 [Paratrimastix pyriformis]